MCIEIVVFYKLTSSILHIISISRNGVTMPYVRKPLEELDVLNNFMFNRLTTDPDTKEKFVRLLLKGLLGIELGEIIIHSEKLILPDNPNKRGVRLDVKVDSISNTGEISEVFDFEPHRDKEKAYPKLTRYRQALLDKDILPSGTKDYDKLPELFIINISNYDPFGYGRMIYSIQSLCLEEPKLCYNDGVRIFYFNTSGTIGGSEELKSFLNYLEDSNSENVVDKVTEEIDGYVNTIRNKGKGDYMTVGDWIDGIVEEAV